MPIIGPAAGGSGLRKGMCDGAKMGVRMRDSTSAWYPDWTKGMRSQRCSPVGTLRIFAGNLAIIVMQDTSHVHCHPR